ncbi:MAG: VOC family protein [Betaproteobacteria bacterium]
MAGQTRAAAVLYAKDLGRVAAFYEGLLGFAARIREEEQVVLESSALELVVVRIPERIAATFEITDPPALREETAVKLVFFVESLAATRAAAPRLGGALNASRKEWRFEGFNVCDGHDPEGNVLQFRELLP